MNKNCNKVFNIWKHCELDLKFATEQVCVHVRISEHVLLALVHPQAINAQMRSDIMSIFLAQWSKVIGPSSKLHYDRRAIFQDKNQRTSLNSQFIHLCAHELCFIARCMLQNCLCLMIHA